MWCHVHICHHYLKWRREGYNGWTLHINRCGPIKTQNDDLKPRAESYSRSLGHWHSTQHVTAKFPRRDPEPVTPVSSELCNLVWIVLIRSHSPHISLTGFECQGPFSASPNPEPDAMTYYWFLIEISQHHMSMSLVHHHSMMMIMIYISWSIWVWLSPHCASNPILMLLSWPKINNRNSQLSQAHL